MAEGDNQRQPEDEAANNSALLDADAEVGNNAALLPSSVNGDDNNNRKVIVVDTKSTAPSKKSATKQKRSHEMEHFLYKQHHYYTKMNHISFGPGRQYYAWGVFMSCMSALCFCGGIVIICVQKFHRWTGFTDKLEFLGPCFLALWVASMGIASWMFYRAYKISSEARRNLRLKGNFDGTGVYLVNPSTDQHGVITGSGPGAAVGVALKTGQKTEKAVQKPPSYSSYHNSPYRVYHPSQTSTPTSSLANWTKSALPASYMMTPPTSTSTPPGQPGVFPAPKDGLGLPTTQTGGAIKDVPDALPALRSQGSSPSLSRAVLQKPSSEAEGVDSGEQPHPLKFSGKQSFDQASMASSSGAGTGTGGDSPRPSRSKASAMPISHQRSGGLASATNAGQARAKPKITGMSSLGSASHSSTSSATANK